jgi:hypothetical protein
LNHVVEARSTPITVVVDDWLAISANPDQFDIGYDYTYASDCTLACGDDRAVRLPDKLWRHGC